MKQAVTTLEMAAQDLLRSILPVIGRGNNDLGPRLAQSVRKSSLGFPVGDESVDCVPARADRDRELIELAVVGDYDCLSGALDHRGINCTCFLVCIIYSARRDAGRSHDGAICLIAIEAGDRLRSQEISLAGVKPAAQNKTRMLGFVPNAVALAKS